MNRHFVYASLLAAIGFNIAIIGCHRKTDHAAKANESTLPSDTMQPVPADEQKSYANSQVEVKTYSNKPPLTGFGYDLYIDGNLTVHQPHIPAASGTDGFESEEKARITGEFVAYKIRNNIMPPKVSMEELDSLGVLIKK